MRWGYLSVSRLAGDGVCQLPFQGSLSLRREGTLPPLKGEGGPRSGGEVLHCVPLSHFRSNSAGDGVCQLPFQESLSLRREGTLPPLKGEGDREAVER